MTLFFRLKRFSTALVFLGLLTAGLLPSTGIPEPGGDPLGRLLQDIGNDRTDYTAYQRLLLSLRRGIDRRTAASDRNIERAAGFFDKLLEESPDDPLRHYARGMTAKLAGDYPAAVGHFEAGIAAGARFWDIFSEVAPY